MAGYNRENALRNLKIYLESNPPNHDVKRMLVNTIDASCDYARLIFPVDDSVYMRPVWSSTEGTVRTASNVGNEAVPAQPLVHAAPAVNAPVDSGGIEVVDTTQTRFINHLITSMEILSEPGNVADGEGNLAGFWPLLKTQIFTNIGNMLGIATDVKNWLNE